MKVLQWCCNGNDIVAAMTLESIDDELLNHIFQYLTPTERCRVTFTSTAFRELPSWIWKERFYTDLKLHVRHENHLDRFLSEDAPRNQQTIRWQTFYGAFHRLLSQKVDDIVSDVLDPARTTPLATALKKQGILKIFLSALHQNLNSGGMLRYAFGIKLFTPIFPEETLPDRETVSARYRTLFGKGKNFDKYYEILEHRYCVKKSTYEESKEIYPRMSLQRYSDVRNLPEELSGECFTHLALRYGRHRFKTYTKEVFEVLSGLNYDTVEKNDALRTGGSFIKVFVGNSEDSLWEMTGALAYYLSPPITEETHPNVTAIFHEYFGL